MPLLVIVFDDCRNTPNKNGAHDERMLVFQALSPHARDHYRAYRPSHPVASAATDLRPCSHCYAGTVIRHKFVPAQLCRHIGARSH